MTREEYLRNIAPDKTVLDEVEQYYIMKGTPTGDGTIFFRSDSGVNGKYNTGINRGFFKIDYDEITDLANSNLENSTAWLENDGYTEYIIFYSDTNVTLSVPTSGSFVITGVAF